MKRWLWIPLAALAAVAPSAARADGPEQPQTAPSAGGRRMTIDECIAVAVQRNPDALSSELEVRAAEAARAGTMGEFGPKLRLEGNALQWNSPFDVVFAPPGTPGPTPPIRVRDAFSWIGTASLIQPITPIYAIYEAYKVRDLGVDVAQIQKSVARRDVAFRVAEVYLRLLEAIRLHDVATTSVTQLEAQKKQAQSLYTNGVIGKNDVLRADLALAGAKERVIQTEGEITLGQGRLATAMGMRAGPPIEPVPLAADVPPADEPTVESAQAHALAQRIELREVALRTQQADGRVAQARARLFPVASLVGSYQHTEGSAFTQLNAAYFGVTATWDAWDWGTTIKGIDEAAARRDQAALARIKLEDELVLEARQSFVAATTARAALDVARSALEQAEENYRIVGRRFGAAEATSFDVVDAEALLTQARARIETTLYGYHVARVALERATGAMTPRVR